MNSQLYRSAIARHQGPRVERPSIHVIEGLEGVRLRPGMYLGSTGPEALEAKVLELVGNSVDQHLAGKATRIAVEVDDSGWVRVEDDGPGLSPLPDARGHTLLVLAFTSLHITPTLDGHHPHVHVRAGFHGVGSGVVSALSARLEVETCFEGAGYRLVCERGAVQPGTRIRYLADPSIFQGTLGVEALERRLHELALLAGRRRWFVRSSTTRRHLMRARTWRGTFAPVPQHLLGHARRDQHTRRAAIDVAVHWRSPERAPRHVTPGARLTHASEWGTGKGPTLPTNDAETSVKAALTDIPQEEWGSAPSTAPDLRHLDRDRHEHSTGYVADRHFRTVDGRRELVRALLEREQVTLRHDRVPRRVDALRAQWSVPRCLLGLSTARAASPPPFIPAPVAPSNWSRTRSVGC